MSPTTPEPPRNGKGRGPLAADAFVNQTESCITRLVFRFCHHRAFLRILCALFLVLFLELAETVPIPHFCTFYALWRCSTLSMTGRRFHSTMAMIRPPLGSLKTLLLGMHRTGALGCKILFSGVFWRLHRNLRCQSVPPRFRNLGWQCHFCTLAELASCLGLRSNWRRQHSLWSWLWIVLQVRSSKKNDEHWGTSWWGLGRNRLEWSAPIYSLFGFWFFLVSLLCYFWLVLLRFSSFSFIFLSVSLHEEEDL